ncbi:hypothetical protein CRUP_033004 [Coryphaenoides rupestris]|nr:hypothetical protein CRUP_033004 [Coryphaenoides rupestris]
MQLLVQTQERRSSLWTCLKWGTKRCGGRGACRLYESNAFRMTFLGLIYTLYMLANLLWMALYYRIVQRARKSSRRQREREDGAERETNGLDADDRRKTGSVTAFALMAFRSSSLV